MKVFWEAYFHWHTSMDPCVANHLCGHRAEKVNVYAFKNKIRDEDNTIKKHAKEIKQMESMLGYIQEKTKR